MHRLRAGLLAVWIAAMTCVSVVGAQVAHAEDYPPGAIEFSKLSNPGPPAWSEVEDHDWNYWRQVIFGRDAEINEALTATSQSPLTALTGVEVKAPSTVNAPVLGNLCKSGYGCTFAAVAGTAMAAYGLLGPNGGNVQAERQEIPSDKRLSTTHVPQYYPSPKAAKCATLNPWGVGNMNEPGKQMSFLATITVKPPTVGCAMSGRLAFDCHKNGTWFHEDKTWNLTDGGSPVGAVKTLVVSNICGATIGTTTGWEVRKIHLDQSMVDAGGGFNQGMDKGFYWGLSDALTSGSLRATTRCQRPDTTQYSVVGTMMPVASGVVDVRPCAPGDKPLWVQTDHIGVDGTTVTEQAVQNIARAAPPDWAPDCKVAGSGCRWVVKVNNVPCTIGQAGCTDWTEHKEDAECFFGPYGMPLESCNLLERAYEPQPAGVTMPATRPNWDGNPTTTTGPARITTPTVAPSPTPTAPAQTSGDTDPTTRPSPSPSGSTSPAPEAPGGSGAPNPTDTAGKACFPSGWAAFNPVQWVLKPIRCALEPDPQKAKTRVDSLRAKLDGKGPGPMIAAVSAVVEQAGDAGGCSGPNMPFHIGDVEQDIHPFSACDEPMATAAQYVKALATVVIVIGGGLAVTRAVASGFGFSFSMGKGSTDGD